MAFSATSWSTLVQPSESDARPNHRGEGDPCEMRAAHEARRLQAGLGGSPQRRRASDCYKPPRRARQKIIGDIYQHRWDHVSFSSDFSSTCSVVGTLLSTHQKGIEIQV